MFRQQKRSTAMTRASTPTTRDTESGATIRPRIAAALGLALATFLAVASMTGAEKLTATYSAADETPGSFESSCSAADGQLVEFTDENDQVMESSCQAGDGLTTCDWYADSCTWEENPQRTETPTGPGTLAGGAVVDDAPAGAQEPSNSPRVAPSDDATGASPRIMASDDDHESKAKAKGKKSKKSKKGNKGRK
jgi:hypothetical protein